MKVAFFEIKGWEEGFLRKRLRATIWSFSWSRSQWRTWRG
jgi:hypothetical protein